MSLSPEQISQRLQGMAATDIAAIVGCHPYRGPLDVYLEKRGEAPPYVGNTRSRWGDILEAPIRNDYEDRHNVRVEVHGTLVHPKHPWWMATPDGLVYRHGASMPDRGLEIKVHGRDAVFFGGLEYGAPGSDEVPPHELIQCEWGMGCTGLDRWDLIAFLDGAPAEYIIDRDDDLIGMLAERGEKFLVDHIQKGEPPAPDGSKAWENWLKARWKKNNDDFIQADDEPEILQLIYELRDARASEADAEALVGRLTQALKNRIGENSGYIWREPGRKTPSKVSWRRSKDGEKDDWRSSFEQIRGDAALLASALTGVPQMCESLRGDGLGDTADLLAKLYETLEGFAKAKPARKTVPGARPFNVPRHWKTATPKKENDSNE